MAKRTMLPEVSKKYILLGIRPGKYNFDGFGLIDLRNISLTEADQLVSDGFSYLKLKQAPIILTGTKEPEKIYIDELKKVNSDKFKYEILNVSPETPPIKMPSTEDFRNNKKFVNTQLSSFNFQELPFPYKLVFFNSEEYFLVKKQLLIRNGNIEQQMRSLHSKVKTIDPDPKFNSDRKKIMDKLVFLEDEKTANWTAIDTWDEPESDTDQDTETAIQKALEREKLIKAHGNYIYRAEITIPDMPGKTDKQKRKRTEKINEVARRKAELIKLGSPYQRKSRKK